VTSYEATAPVSGPPQSEEANDSNMGPMGIFGGTFDPIHYGHLRTALELLEGLSLEEVRFIPSGLQPLRDEPTAPSETRLSMVRAAVESEARFSVDTRELRRRGPSYSIDTLTGLRAEHEDRSLCFLLGMDAFLGLPDWHRWEELIGLVHIVVAHRPGWQDPVDGELGDLVRKHATKVPQDLLVQRCGRIFLKPVTQLAISASGLRGLIRTGLDPRYLVPESVRAIIQETECYAEEPTENTLG